ncbi:MAG: aminotransferase class I/II-fold pyridoxal phosphate-dependent enzyme, partial [Filifactor alocis]|nr:aminotransferase class I/II-fold pyridoxal phosphate-dependent enzyme [Filifactor alocis]
MEKLYKKLKQIKPTWIENKIMGNNLSIKRKLRGRKMDRIYESYTGIEKMETTKQVVKTAKFKVRARKNTADDTNIQRHFPNWTENNAREAFFSLGKFAINESERNAVSDFLGGKIEKRGIYDRFKFYLEEYPLDRGLQFISNTLEYANMTENIAPEELLYELVESVLAMTHPKNGKFSPYMEKLLSHYLRTVLNFGDIEGELDLFPTEGSNISVHYLIHSLMMNGVLEQGDKVAFFVPKHSREKIETLFSKLEIDCVFVNYDVFEEGEAELIEEELGILEDERIKVLFMVGRSSRFVLEQNQVLNNKIDELLREINPNLILVPDEMYAPFLKNYRSLYLSYPENTIVLYSFSQYFGAPGWKLGTIMMSKNNVVDKLIEGFSDE